MLRDGSRAKHSQVLAHLRPVITGLARTTAVPGFALEDIERSTLESSTDDTLVLTGPGRSTVISPTLDAGSSMAVVVSSAEVTSSSSTFETDPHHHVSPIFLHDTMEMMEILACRFPTRTSEKMHTARTYSSDRLPHPLGLVSVLLGLVVAGQTLG